MSRRRTRPAKARRENVPSQIHRTAPGFLDSPNPGGGGADGGIEHPVLRPTERQCGRSVHGTQHLVAGVPRQLGRGAVQLQSGEPDRGACGKDIVGKDHLSAEHRPCGKIHRRPKLHIRTRRLGDAGKVYGVAEGGLTRAAEDQVPTLHEPIHLILARTRQGGSTHQLQIVGHGDLAPTRRQEIHPIPQGNLLRKSGVQSGLGPI